MIYVCNCYKMYLYVIRSKKNIFLKTWTFMEFGFSTVATLHIINLCRKICVFLFCGLCFYGSPCYSKVSKPNTLLNYIFYMFLSYLISYIVNFSIKNYYIFVFCGKIFGNVEFCFTFELSIHFLYALINKCGILCWLIVPA